MAKTEYRPRLGIDIRIKPDKKSRKEPREEKKVGQPCSSPGCEAKAEFKVPKSREQLSEYIWLCRAHTRAHNEAWDFFAGMNDSEIQKFRIEALTGHRPTWKLGERAAGPRRKSYTLRDTIFGEPDEQKEAVRRPERQLTRLQFLAFETLSLEPSATLIEIKARYKELVKRYHPDANGGSRDAEERLKQVIKAYGVLRASGLI
jgi:hypothetical protein